MRRGEYALDGATWLAVFVTAGMVGGWVGLGITGAVAVYLLLT